MKHATRWWWWHAGFIIWKKKVVFLHQVHHYSIWVHIRKFRHVEFNSPNLDFVSPSSINVYLNQIIIKDYCHKRWYYIWHYYYSNREETKCETEMRYRWRSARNFKPLHHNRFLHPLLRELECGSKMFYLLEGIGRLLCVISTELRVHKVVERERRWETSREI